MFDDAEMKKSQELTRIYCDRYKLTKWKFSDLHRVVDKFDREAICRKPEFFKSGCYFIYSDTGILLYVGKSSQPESAVGSRLLSHFGRIPPWNPELAFVQIFEVENDYEACSLEIFLIRILRPKYNNAANKNRPTGIGYDQCEYKWFEELGWIYA